MALTEQEIEKKAFDEIQRAHANKAPSNLSVKQQLSVFGGTLIVVRWHNGVENRDTESSVFAKGDEVRFFWTPADLVKFLDDTQPSRTSITASLRELLTVGGGTLVIAVIVIVTICYLAVFRNVDKLQEALAPALSLILGFYFGSKTTK